MSWLKKALKFTGFAALAAMALLVIASSLHVGGWKALSVQTGSMRPAIKPGDLVLVNRVPVSELQIGDVITYINPNNPKQTITHRIIAINGPQITVKGDANKSPDPVVFAHNVIGKVQKDLPYLGYAVNFARSWVGISLLIYLPALLITFDEFRRLMRYYESKKPYVTQQLLARLRQSESQKGKRLMAVKISAWFILFSLFLAVPVLAALSSQATLTGNTISAVVPPNQCPSNGNSTNVNINVNGSGGNNNNSVDVNNSNSQTATSGDVTGPNATSGDATNCNSTNININITNNP